jgi:hypothetical protein
MQVPPTAHRVPEDGARPAAGAGDRASLPAGFAAALARIAADHPEAERIEVWFQDEARVGQKGRMVRRWFQRGMRLKTVAGKQISITQASAGVQQVLNRANLGKLVAIR